jgi:hypothetical protein
VLVQLWVVLVEEFVQPGHGRLDALVAVVQLFAVVVPKLGHQVDEAPKGVRLSALPRVLVRVGAEDVIDGRQQLVHALHVGQPRVQLGIHKQRALHLL